MPMLPMTRSLGRAVQDFLVWSPAVITYGRVMQFEPVSHNQAQRRYGIPVHGADRFIPYNSE